MKRHPTLRLEHVIDYAQPLPPPAPDRGVGLPPPAPDGAGGEEGEGGVVGGVGAGRRGAGYCFMDSPGNDLESVAGQVAAGAGLVFCRMATASSRGVLARGRPWVCSCCCRAMTAGRHVAGGGGL